MPPQFAKKSYKIINDVFHQVFWDVASNSVFDSANEIHSLVKEGQDVVVDKDVSLDETWQKRAILLKMVLWLQFLAPQVNV